MRSLLKRITGSSVFRNSLWLLAEKFLLLAAGLIFTVLLSRYWTVADFGAFQYLLAFIALLSPFYSLGLNSLVSGLLVQFPMDDGKIIGTAMCLRFAGALIGIIVGLCISYWFIEERFWLLLLVLLLAQLTQVLSVIEFFFEAKIQSKISAIIRTSVGLIFLFVKIFAVIKGADLTVILLITCFEWLMLGAMWLVVYQRYGDGIAKLSWCSKRARYFIARCGWLFFSSIAAVVYLKIDQLMLGKLVGTQAVAYYSVASRLSEVWYLIPTILVASCFPRLIQAKQTRVIEHNQNYIRLLQLWCNSLCWLAILIASLMTIAAPLLITRVFGEVYAASITILQIHIWAGVFIFMRALFSKWIIIEDIPRYSLLTHGLGALINVVLNLLFIPIWGGEGAAFATLVSYAIASYLALFLFQKTRPMAWVMTRSLFMPITYFRSVL